MLWQTKTRRMEQNQGRGKGGGGRFIFFKKKETNALSISNTKPQKNGRHLSSLNIYVRECDCSRVRLIANERGSAASRIVLLVCWVGSQRLLCELFAEGEVVVGVWAPGDLASVHVEPLQAGSVVGLHAYHTRLCHGRDKGWVLGRPSFLHPQATSVETLLASLLILVLLEAQTSSMLSLIWESAAFSRGLGREVAHRKPAVACTAIAVAAAVTSWAGAACAKHGGRAAGGGAADGH